MTDLFTQFKTALTGIIGKPCWNIQAGAIGAMASLHLGEKVPLDKPLPFPNTSLTPDEHKFRGKFVLYIEDCPWRLDGNEAVIASWTDDNSPKGRIITGLNSLIGQTVTQVTLTRPGLDVILTFETGTTLRIFPDQSDPNEGDNYSLSVKDSDTFIITAQSKIIKE